MSKLFVVGIGPGGKEHMTFRAIKVLKECDYIVGYKPYLEYINELIEDKECYTNGMKGELDRCQHAIDKVKEGLKVAIISTGDAGLYGMAGPIYELSSEIDIEVVPGVSSAFSAAAELGAPIMHDFATISLSDLMTPWELIEKRLHAAAAADFVISIYNPRSKGRPDYLRKAIDILLKYKDSKTPVGIVRDSGRPGTTSIVTNLEDINCETVDMKSIVIVGNKTTMVKAGKIVTARGYEKYDLDNWRDK